MKIGDRDVDPLYHRAYKVEKANGEWLWLVSGSMAGWAKIADVVPYDQAIDYYTHEIRANPAAAWAYLSRGLVWHGKDELDIAVADYNEAIRLDPKKCVAYNDRGVCWGEKGENERAIADFSETLRLDPKYSIALSNRGEVYCRVGEYAKAISDCNEAIRLSARFVAPYVHRANAWSGKGRFENADKDFIEALRIEPREYEACTERAWFLATCPDEKFRDGKKAFEFALIAYDETEGKYGRQHAVLAASYAENGDFAHAVEWQRKAIRLYRIESERELARKHLALYQDGKPVRGGPLP